MHSFMHPFVHPTIRSFVLLFTYHSFISSVLSFIHPSIHPTIRSFVHSFTYHPFICSLICLFPVNVSSANAFHHFLLQAQGATPVGTFVSPPAHALLKKCVSDGDSVTHSDDADKKEISFRWVAPDNLDSFKFV